MGKLFVFLLLATSLDISSTRPSQKGKKSGCLKAMSQKMPKFMLISLNSDVNLTCPFTEKNITFLKHCERINSSRVTASWRSLAIKKFVTMDSGKYTCQSTTSNGQVKEFNWVLHIKFNKQANSTADYREEPVRSKVLIDCRKFVRQTIFFSQKKGQLLSRVPNSRLNKNTSPKVHELFDLTTHDTGFYYCGNSAASLALKLVVREPPKVTIISGKSVVKPGDNVQFKCDYKGPQKIAWFKENKLISVSNKSGKSNVIVKLVNLGSNKQSLRLNIRNVDKTDSGKYRCGVKFHNTRVFSTDIKLTVFAFQDDFGIYGNYNQRKSKVFFFCNTNDVNGIATYTLLKKPLDNKDKYPYTVVLTSSAQMISPEIFVITSVSSADQGYYKCVATLQGVSIEREFDDPIWLGTS